LLDNVISKRKMGRYERKALMIKPSIYLCHGPT
jgi:hypothetical protein